ncbi:MAG: arginine--tRNA ligase [Candidatus Paceibacterota bacterium]
MLNFIKNIFKKEESDLFFRVFNDLKSIVGDECRLDTPPEHIEADFSITTSNPKDNPKLVEKIKEKELGYIEDVKIAGPFINLFLKRDLFFSNVLDNIYKRQESYGSSNVRKKIFIEYSSPNIAKPLGVGHLRSLVIGESLSRIYKKAGYKVFKENYLGDWGTQFGKMIYAYQKWGDEEKIKQNPTKELKTLYVKFQKESEKDKTIEDNAREIFNSLEKGDEELLKLWKKFRELSIEEFKEVYNRFGVEFDNYSGESHYVKSSLEIIEEIKNKGLCEEGEGESLIVELEDLPSFLIRKKDGSTLYLTRDIAALRDRVKKHNPDKLIYVVGNEQSLHFQQLFKISEALGIINKNNVEHVANGLILIDGKKMSTRKGTTINLSQLLDESVQRSRNVIEEKNSSLSEEEKAKISEIIGVGSVVYNDLRHYRLKDVNFEWDKVLNFEGGSAVYLQYTYARINSILNKLNQKSSPSLSKYIFEDEVEFDIAKHLFSFPKVIKNSCDRKEPHVICNYLEDLAKHFNSFYNKVSIINTEDENLKASRIALAHSTALVIKEGLRILSVDVPEKM